MPATSLERRAERCHNPVTKTVVAEASRMQRILRTPPKNSEPDGEPVAGAGFKPARPRRGNPCGCPFARVCPFKIRANGLLSGRRLSASPGGRGYSTSERGNRAMTGAVLSHDASRRPDGLATPGVLDQNELQAANRAMQSTRAQGVPYPQTTSRCLRLVIQRVISPSRT